MFRIKSFLILLYALPTLWGANEIALNEKEYFEAPGISFLLFHNNYLVGYQGGLQLVQNGERILDSGDLLLRTKEGVAQPGHGVIRREADGEANAAMVYGEIDDWGIGYRFETRTDGAKIYVKLVLDRPLDPAQVETAGFQICLYPTTYYSKSYQSEKGMGVFPRHYAGKEILLEGSRLRIAAEDPLHAVTFQRDDGMLMLADRRHESVQRWFYVVAPLAPGETELEVAIVPTIRPEWRRKPVIGISQIGYHPAAPKRAIIELDSRAEAAGLVRPYRVAPSGEREVAQQGSLRPWGVFHGYRYGVFDFSEIREPGIYLLEYAGERAGPFQIAEGIFREAWTPTLRYFLPTQMCHVKVREGSRVWHGACHLDDAQQAPAHTMHLDGYQQTDRETSYADNEHVPGLDWGGWHDAGDHDIPAGSLCNTIEGLALAAEEFRPSLDLTSISRQDREVVLHRPDNQDDLLQQIAFGVEWLLATYEAGGHILPGVVERTGFQYGTIGDMANTTDNLVYDPTLDEYEVKDGRSGKLDDRWVFTNRNTGLQYRTVKTLAMAHRVLEGAMPELAAKCLRVAQELWRYEQEHDPAWGRSAYTPRDTGYRGYEMEATAELFLTTGDRRYREHLLSLASVFESAPAESFAGVAGWTLARTLPRINNQQFEDAVRRKLAQWKKISDRQKAASPYGTLYPDEVSDPGYKLESRSGIHSGFVWGHGWNFQKKALHHYYLHKHLPDLFGPDVVFDTVNYVLGCHPGTNESLVSSVGAHSTLAAYGFNRADWSHQPGGIISGTSLIKPDLLELKHPFPFLWYQTEIVIGGAGTWIFDVLAAEKLATGIR